MFREAAQAREEDPTLREYPMPTELLEFGLPPLPEGKLRWVYRGTFEGDYHGPFHSKDRTIRYFWGDRWYKTRVFSSKEPHIEAV
jgi:hypothetical protein